jgi:hypothetical protein
MPYIKQERRDALNKWLSLPRESEARIKSPGPGDAGELNFCLTMLLIDQKPPKQEDFEAVMHAYIASQVPMRYARLNDIVGAAECAVLEADRRAPHQYLYQKLLLSNAARKFYSQVAAPYEDTKIRENGDIHYRIWRTF